MVTEIKDSRGIIEKKKKKGGESQKDLWSVLTQECPTTAPQDGFGFTSTVTVVLPPFSHEWKQTGYSTALKQDDTQ